MQPAIIEVITKKKFDIAYQKIFSLATGEVLGREALARGRSPGLRTPKELFSAADRCGLTKDLDLACLEKAADSAPKDGLLFLNVYPFTLAWLAGNESLARDLLRGPERIVFELVEVESWECPEALAEAASVLGCRLAVDDISRGYNRLEFLAVLKPAFVKLDDPLIRDCHLSREKRLTIKHLKNLAADIGAETVAERIEKREELEVIIAAGVEYGQGFYLSRPEILRERSVLNGAAV